jgi:hypothetical protein
MNSIRRIESKDTEVSASHVELDDESFQFEMEMRQIAIRALTELFPRN